MTAAQVAAAEPRKLAEAPRQAAKDTRPEAQFPRGHRCLAAATVAFLDNDPRVVEDNWRDAARMFIDAGGTLEVAE